MRTNFLAVLPFLAVLTGSLMACGGTTAGGGGGGGSGSVSGTVAGTTFTVASQLAAIQPASGTSTCTGPTSDGGQMCTSSSTGQVVAVLLTNRGDATCSLAQSEATSNTNEQLASFDLLELAVVNEAGTVATGTYAVIVPGSGATSGAAATFGTTTSTCASALTANATSGSVTLTQVDGGNVTGTYDVTFGTQGTFTGSFDVAVCTLPDAGGTTSSGPDAGTVCRP